jgi:Polyketide cyclase / dehydrase and lipid transport
MKIYQTSEQIEASPAAVWQVLVEVCHWPMWTPTVTRVEALDGDKLALGQRFRITQPKLRPAVWKVTALEPGANFVWEASAPGMRMSATHTVRQVESAQTQIELAFSFQGPVGTVVAWLYRGLVESYLRTEAVSLKAFAERASRPGRSAA